MVARQMLTNAQKIDNIHCAVLWGMTIHNCYRVQLAEFHVET